MNIGILTFHRAANYGAVLQTFALQNKLIEMGNQVEIIDYRCNAIEKMHSPFYFKANNGMEFIKKILRFRVRLIKRLQFNKFITRKLNLNLFAIKSEDKFYQYTEKFDVVITGSDQVWNEELTEGDFVYFLSRMSRDKKVSYAPSIGIDNIEKLSRTTLDYISEFSLLSFRERGMATKLQNKINKKVFSVLDPIFLLSIDEWEKFSEKQKEKGYILIYGLKNQKSLDKIALVYAKKTDKLVISISDTINRSKGITYVTCPTPEQWVGLIRNADYVVTDSFHGTAFSILFCKNIIVMLGSYPGRVIDLLERCEIDYYLIDNYMVIECDKQWNNINVNLRREKLKSLNYLNNIQRKIE